MFANPPPTSGCGFHLSFCCLHATARHGVCWHTWKCPWGVCKPVIFDSCLFCFLHAVPQVGFRPQNLPFGGSLLPAPIALGEGGQGPASGPAPCTGQLWVPTHTPGHFGVGTSPERPCGPLPRCTQLCVPRGPGCGAVSPGDGCPAAAGTRTGSRRGRSSPGTSEAGRRLLPTQRRQESGRIN